MGEGHRIGIRRPCGVTVPGPLAGVRVVEFVGQGPGPFGGMMLADMGADVVAVERPGAPVDFTRAPTNPLTRGKRNVELDLKDPAALAVMVAMIGAADVFIDPFRPGVCERLNIGPTEMCEANSRLVYARMTGFGQTGPWAKRAGHDINYIALSGVLHSVGRAGEPPTIPLNLVGDFAGGGQLLALGVCAALVERSTSGFGQVIDVSMVEGAAQILGPIFAGSESGFFGDRGTTWLDGGAHFYNVYAASDGRYMSVGAVEPQFHAELLARLNMAPDTPQWESAQWPALTAEMASIFATKTGEEWCEVFADSDACVAPVLAPSEVASHTHTAARNTVTRINGVLQPNPAPLFSRTPSQARAPHHRGTTTAADIITEWTTT